MSTELLLGRKLAKCRKYRYTGQGLQHHHSLKSYAKYIERPNIDEEQREARINKQKPEHFPEMEDGQPGDMMVFIIHW